jgi:hypothetical protein
VEMLLGRERDWLQGWSETWMPSIKKICERRILHTHHSVPLLTLHIILSHCFVNFANIPICLVHKTPFNHDRPLLKKCQ